MTNAKLDTQGTNTLPGLLLVDDEDNVLSSLRRLFRKSGCQIYTANSGQKGIEVLKEQNIDVIVSDARMPEMSGPEFLAIAAEEYPNTVRILLTGYADMEAVVDAVNLWRISHYLEKPWDDEKLKALVDETFVTIGFKKENEYLQSLVSSQNEKLTEVNESLEATVKERTQKIIEINSTLQENYKNTIDLFANLLAMRNPNNIPNVPDIVSLVTNIADVMALPQREQIHLTRAAKMRYMSQMGFTDDLLQTPYASMSEVQKKEYEQYPLRGAQLMRNIRPLIPVADIIMHHKEYLNGEGYPKGEKDSELTLSVQILTVANDFIELLTGKMQSPPLSRTEAIEYLELKAGSFYSADAVEALKSLLFKSKVKKAIINQPVLSSHLTNGMALSCDLKNHAGDTLLPKGSLLADSTITIITELERSTKQAFQISVDIPAGLEVSHDLVKHIQGK